MKQKDEILESIIKIEPEKFEDEYARKVSKLFKLKHFEIVVPE